MVLIPLTHEHDIRQALDLVWPNLKKGSQELEHMVGSPGGAAKLRLYWHRDKQFWTLLYPRQAKNRYWMCFGTDDPTVNDNTLNITCEINPPHKGMNRRCAGLFARDDEGRIYLTHSGKIGGGRKGVGKSAFIAYYRGENWETVFWPDKQETDVIVIGEIRNDHLRAQVAHFIQEVKRFKELTTSSNLPTVVQGIEPSFKPEFGGLRKTYHVDRSIASRCDHGPVISALEAALSARGYKAFNDRQRDLFLYTKDRKTQVLFEAKTTISTTNLYEGVGQLMMHGAAQAEMPKRILVLPKFPNEQTCALLSRLEITVLTYSWHRGKPIFSKLDTTLTTVLGLE